MLVGELLSEQVEVSPDRLALISDLGPRLTYRQWDQGSNRVSRGLANTGIEVSDRVGLMHTNDKALDFLVSYIAIHKAGAVVVPLNPRLSHGELKAIADHCDLSAIITPDGDRAQTLGRRHIELGAFDDCDDSPHQIPRSDSDLADIIYTSGTTGTPKGVACTHGNVTFSAMRGVGPGLEGRAFLHAIPLTTFAGIHAMTLIPLRGGMTNVIMSAFDPGRYLDLLREHRVAMSYAVPSMLILALKETERLAAGGFETFHVLMYGSAPMPTDAVLKLAEHFPRTRLINLYGLTEGGGAVCMLSPKEAKRRPGSLGKPVPPTEIQIAEDGEIWLRAPVQARSYYRDDAATQKTWTKEGWLRTGDIGRFDEDGYLYLVDRKKDLVIRGGLNVAPAEIEAQLIQHPSVEDAAVVGIAHPVLGEDTFAFIIPKNPVKPDELEAFLRGRIADFKIPRSYRFETEFPRNAMGKVLKTELKKRAS